MEDVKSHEAASHDVFLSFSGEDTRKTFVDHLYEKLVDVGYRTFRDNEGIERGESIKSELERAILQSRCSIVVLSENFPSSSWCLDELVLILQHKRKNSRHVVLPLFYKVDPSDFRKQKGSVGDAFAVHERKEELPERIKVWREALREVADLGGMHLQNQANGHEAQFIKKVVKVIEEKLKRTIQNVPSYLVGIESRVKDINLWLQDGSTEVGIVAIYGMSGIGKTTIAKYVFNLNFERFEASSFLENIREAYGQQDGLIRLQRQLLSDISRGGIIRIRDAMCSKRILLVLDDMDNRDQFKEILEMRESLHPGTKIIITTRHMWLLPHEFDEIHYLEKMGFGESFKLFNWHAFGQEYPSDAYTDHSKRVVTQCGGLPLALEVLGSSLRGKGVDVWKSALKKLEAINDHQIFKKLVISYDCLPDDHDKSLFLEIACFFLGKDKDYMVTILEECGFHTIVGIQNLVDRCLLTIDPKNKLTMHQMVRDMGREVIRRESPREPGKRTRLWHYKDSFHVLRGNTGSGTITGLALDMKMVKEDKSLLSNQRNSLKHRRFGFLSWHSLYTSSAYSHDVYLTTDAFTSMRGLSLLQINYTELIGGYEEFPKNLRWLCWRGFPKKCVPNDFPLESLVAIDMRNSCLEQAWKGNRLLGLLKILNLSHSHELIRTPDFAQLPQLEQLILKDCASLVEVHESIGNLETKLIVLNLKDCRNLKNLPKNICMLKVLEKLVISGCSNLDEFPKEMGKMESLKVFHADKIAMSPSASTTSKDGFWPALISTWVTRPRKCPKLFWGYLPQSIVSLSLSDCNLHDYSFPMFFSNLPSLKKLDLSRNPICSLPDFIRGLTSLELLQMSFCTSLQELINLPSIRDLRLTNCLSLGKVTFQSKVCKAPAFMLVGCKKLAQIEGRFKLETVENLDNEVMYQHDLQAFNSFEVVMFNARTHTKWKFPKQVPHDRGIINIFLPGGEVPGCFSSKSVGSSVSITVPPPPPSFHGLNVRVVYAIDEHWGSWSLFVMVISNETKDLKFKYFPTCYGLPKPDEYITWSSYWKFHKSQMDIGDQLNIKLSTGFGFKVKEIGVRLVYYKQAHSSDDFVPMEESHFEGNTPIICIGSFGWEWILYNLIGEPARKALGPQHVKLFEEHSSQLLL